MSAGTPTLRVIPETECSSGCGGDSSSEQAESPHEGATKPRIVRQFTWTERQGVSMMVPVSFGKVSVSAVVDTAAQNNSDQPRFAPEVEVGEAIKHGASRVV